MLTGEQLGRAISDAIQKKGVTQRAVAAHFGVKPPSVQDWIKRGTIDKGKLPALWAYFSDTVGPEHWGLTSFPGAGASTQQRPAASNVINLTENPDYPAVRRVRFKLSAGASGFAVEYLDDDDAPIVFRRQWFESNGYDPEKLFAVRVANGSMEPGLNDGDTVVVNTAQTNPKDGVAFAVNYEGELVIKRLVRDAGQWWLCSDNADQHRYPRKVCHEGTFIVGEIVHKQSEKI